MGRRRSALPGFGLTMGFTLVYLSLIVLIPLATLALKTTSMSGSEIYDLATSPRAMASYKVTFGISLLAALINILFGTLVAWALVRYQFPGKSIVDAIVDVPFALPTAVSGLALTAVFAPNGWLGQFLAPLGIEAVYSRIGVLIALTFISLPFVVRTVQPVLEEIEPEVEEAAATLGATRLQTLQRVILPALWPAMVTGFALAFARAIGEYGSVVFISGNKQFSTEITPHLIMQRLDEFKYESATAMALVMLTVSFALLLAINGFSAWVRGRQEGAHA